MTRAVAVNDASAEYSHDQEWVPVGYKKTEVGIIPDDWQVQSAKDIFIKIQDGTHFSPKLNGQGEYLYITSKNIKFGALDFSSVEYIDSEQHRSIYKRCDVRKGDILLTKDGANTGNAALNTEDDEFSLLSSVAFMRVDEKINCAGFFLQQILSNRFQKVIQHEMSGNAITRLTLAKINGLKFLTPSRKEQTAIANALSDVDALINALEKLIAKKQAIKTAAMQQLLTGRTRLPPFAFREDGTPKGTKQSELGEIPEDWKIRTIIEIAEYQKALFDDGDWIEAEHITDKGIRLIQTGNIGVGEFIEKEEKKFIYEDSFSKLKCKELQIGDVLICRLAEPAGRACFFPDIGEDKVITSVDVTIFRPKENIVNRQYLVQYFSSENWFKSVLEQVGGTTHKRISRGALGKIGVPFPSKKEQTAIATILSDMDVEIQALQQRLVKTRHLKQGMMQELLTGRTRLVKP